MASKVYETLDIELQDGREVTVRPLNIRLLRKFMVVMDKISKADDDEASLDALLEACGIALEKQLGADASNKEKLEELLDLPTMWKIVEIAGGIKLDPNLAAAAAAAQDGLI